MIGTRWLPGLVALASLALFLLLPSCVSDENGVTHPVSDNAAAPPLTSNITRGIPPPPVPEPPRVLHPDLDSALWGLIEAEERGEAEAYARPRGIELVAGSVWVSIECKPGQIEAAVQAATKYAQRLHAINEDGLDALVPIPNLISLADEESIRFVRLPLRPVIAETGN